MIDTAVQDLDSAHDETVDETSSPRSRMNAQTAKFTRKRSRLRENLLRVSSTTE